MRLLKNTHAMRFRLVMLPPQDDYTRPGRPNRSQSPGGSRPRRPVLRLTMVQSVPVEVEVERRHSATKLTYADYVRFPEDGLRHEIIDGEHYVTPSPATQHQRIVRNLLHLIQSHLDTHPAGERARFLTSKNLQGPPDLVIEILSPSTRSRDKRLKRDLYERVGVLEYWIVDPEQDLVEVHRAAGGQFALATRVARRETLTTPLLPGLEVLLDRGLA